MNEISIVGISLGVELLVHNCDNSNILRNIRLNMGCLYIYFILFTFLSTMTQYLQYKLVLLLLILLLSISLYDAVVDGMFSLKHYPTFFCFWKSLWSNGITTLCLIEFRSDAICALDFSGRFLITNSASLLVIGLIMLPIFSSVILGGLCFWRNLFQLN